MKLKGDNAQNGEYDSDNPEAGNDFAFVIAGLLIMVMQRAHQEDAAALAIFLLGMLEVGYLHHHTQILYEENAADDRHQQFFANDDGQRGDDAAQCQAARIAHKHLRRIGIVPKKPDTGPHKCTNEHGQLTQVRDVHDVEIAGEDEIARHVGEDAEANSRNGRDAGGQPIDSIGNICAVADGSDDNSNKEDVQQAA